MTIANGFIGLADVNEYLGSAAVNYNRAGIISEYNDLASSSGKPVPYPILMAICRRHLKNPDYVATVGYDYIDDVFVVYVVRVGGWFEVTETIPVPSGEEDDAREAALRIAQERDIRFVSPNDELLYGLDA
jgi:hypothetical protein